MSDTLTKEQRRKNMQAIRSQSKLENRVSKALWKKGYRFRKNTKSLMGHPDISIKKYQIVIFIDSCFWHQCELHANRPKSNQNYWDHKFARNKARDSEVNNYYLDRGWNLKRVWEHDLKSNFDKTIDELVAFIENSKRNSI